MAYDISTVSVGDRTLKSHFDQLLDNTKYLHDNVLGISAGAISEHVGATTAPIFDKYVLSAAVGRAFADTDVCGFLSDTGAGKNGAGWVAYGKTNATSPGRLGLPCGHEDLATGGANMDAIIYEYSTAGTTSIAKFNTTAWINYNGRIRRDISAGTLDICGGATGTATDGGTVYAGAGSASGYTAYNAIRTGKPWQWYAVAGAAKLAEIDSVGNFLLYDSGSLYANFNASTRAFDLRASSGLTQILLDPAGGVGGGPIIDFPANGPTITAKSYGDLFLDAKPGGQVLLNSSSTYNFWFDGTDGSMAFPTAAADPALPGDGRIWYMETGGVGYLKARINGVTMIIAQNP